METCERVSIGYKRGTDRIDQSRRPFSEGALGITYRSECAKCGSYWEVVIKSIKGRLKVGDPGAWWRDALDQLAATPLALRAEHVTEIYGLPPIHKDPFERILVAQATVEQPEIVTTDGEFRRYASSRLRVVS